MRHLFLLPLLPLALSAQSPPRDLDAYVTQALSRFDQPGVAIGVIQDGKIVFAKGWGVRRIGDPAPITAHTLFQVASNTKSVTSAALAILVSEGKLHWDDPVTDYLPWFRLGGDPYVSRELTVRDLLVHRSGLSLGAGDLLWFHSTLTREEIAHRLRFIAPGASFRSGYAYDNVLFIVAGLVVEAVSGMKWETFVRERILGPIGMNETGTDIGMFGSGDVASPHGRVNGRMKVIPLDSVENTAPAGAINSTITDWLEWLRVQMDSGRVDPSLGLWGEAETRAMWSPGIWIPTGTPAAGLEALAPNFAAYGLGWYLRDYRGLKVVFHDGGLAGMLSRAIMVPARKLGIVVFTNAEGAAYEALAWYVLDYYLGAPRTDWVAAYLALQQNGTAADSVFEDSAQAARHREIGPSVPIERLAGRYTDDWYGDATFTVENGHLVMHWSHSPALTADLEHWQYDTFRARMRAANVADAFVTFDLKYDGTVDRVTLAPVLPSTDFSFDYQDLLFRPGT
ncbi:MAG TPA: serine hydrolase [Gemmatimonadales bacterium]|nr:serine hydrolase [Gemmatimonadales bacterium]